MKSLTFFLTMAGCILASTLLGAEWQTDYEKALATAKSSGKNVFINFTGSDWCGPCIALHDRVFTQKEFLDYADNNLILVEVDYPKKKTLPAETKEQNAKLKVAYHIDKLGFPTIALISPSGKLLGTSTGYDDEKPADIIARIERWAKQ